MLTEQVGSLGWYYQQNGFYSKKPWKRAYFSSRPFTKRLKARAERRRAKADPECFAYYGRYAGWWW